MPRTASLSIREVVGDDALLEVARLMQGSPLWRPPGFVEAPPRIDHGGDDELMLFADYDGWRGGGRGYFSQDRDECRSRRIDLRGPTDLDPGPLPMEEAPDGVPAIDIPLPSPEERV